MTDTTHKLDGFMSQTDTVPEVGQITVETPRGPVVAWECPGLTTIKLEGPEHSSVCVLLYEPTMGEGTFVQMTPALARNVGASLLHLANLVEEQVTQ